MADKKEIKLIFSIDEQTVSRARQVIRDMTSDLEKLNKAAGSGFFGGGGGGGGGMVSAMGTSKLASPSQGRNQQSMAQMPSLTQPLAQTFLAHKNVFASMAKDSKESMKAMTDSLRAAVKEQKSLIEELQKEASSIDYSHSQATKGFGPGGSVMGATQRSQMLVQTLTRRAQVGAQLQQAQTGLSTLQEMLPATAGTAPSMLSRAANAAGGMSTAMLARLGLSPAMLGVGGAAMIGAWGLRNAASWGMDYNMIAGRNEAQNAIFQRRSHEVYNNELRGVVAERAILSDPNRRQRWNDQGAGWRRALHFGKGLASDWGGLFEDPNNYVERKVEESRNQMISDYRASNPIRDQVMGEAQNAQTTVSTLRAMGLGVSKSRSNLNRLYGVRTGFGGSWTDGDIIGGLSAVEQTGLFSGRMSLAAQGMYGNVAGLRGLGGMLGTMQKHGGTGNARRFGHALSALGLTGIDQTAATSIGQFTAGAVNAFGEESSGAGFVGQGLLNSLTVGMNGNTMASRLIAEQNIRGAQSYQASVTGNTSPWQAARNVMNAMAVAPHLGAYSTSMLSRNLSVTEVHDALNNTGGDISGILRAGGMTKKDVMAYLRAEEKTQLERVTANGFTKGSNSRKLYEALSSSGLSYREFMGQGQGEKLGLSTKELDYAYADILTAGGVSRENALGEARIRRGASAGETAGRKAQLEKSLQESQLEVSKGMLYELKQLNVNMTSKAATARHADNEGNLQTLHNSGDGYDPTTAGKDPYYDQAARELGAPASTESIRKRAEQLRKAGGASQNEAVNFINQASRFTPSFVGVVQNGIEVGKQVKRAVSKGDKE